MINKTDDEKSINSGNQYTKLAEFEEGLIDPPKKSHQILSVLFIIFIITLLILGLLNSEISSIFPLRLIKNQKKITLISSNKNHILFSIEANDNRELRLLNTGTEMVFDISRGNDNIITSALSPNEDIVTFLSKNDSGVYIYILKLANNASKIIRASTLDSSIFELSKNKVSICDWSKIYWSPDGSKFAFWVFSDDFSFLCMVQILENYCLKALSSTKENDLNVREAIWLENGNILVSLNRKSNKSLYLIDTIFDKKLQIIYTIKN